MKRYLWIVVLALLAFEVFNFGVTHFALSDMLGSIAILGISWSTLLTIAFCGIDLFAVAHAFSGQDINEPFSALYLFGVWMLGAGFNATLAWWGISVVLAQTGNHGSHLPLIIALFVFLVRILIVGTLAFTDFGTASQYIKGTNQKTEIYSVRKEE